MYLSIDKFLLNTFYWINCICWINLFKRRRRVHVGCAGCETMDAYTPNACAELTVGVGRTTIMGTCWMRKMLAARWMCYGLVDVRTTVLEREGMTSCSWRRLEPAWASPRCARWWRGTWMRCAVRRSTTPQGVQRSYECVARHMGLRMGTSGRAERWMRSLRMPLASLMSHLWHLLCRCARHQLPPGRCSLFAVTAGTLVVGGTHCCAQCCQPDLNK